MKPSPIPVLVVSLIMILSGGVLASGYTVKTGSAYVVASGSIVCDVSAPWFQPGWNKVYDDGTLERFQQTLHFRDYTSFVFYFEYNLHAPGWFDLAQTRWQIFHGGNLLLDATYSTDADLGGNRLSPRYTLSDTYGWTVSIWAQGFDNGSPTPTCNRQAVFHLDNA
jgi:hypothetical protein